MKVKFSPNTKRDFGKYKEYLDELKKSDTRKYNHIKPVNEKKKLRDNIAISIGNKDNHSDSIFPEEFDYSSGSHKMYIDKKSHHVVFYKVVKPKKGEPYVSIEKCIHSKELRKELEKKDIKPLEDSDPNLLLDYITIEKEDKVNDETLTDDEREEYKKKEEELKERISSKSEGIEKEDKDEHGNPRQHKTGPKGGKYYRVKIDGKWGPWNSVSNESIKDIKTLLTESNITPLWSFIKPLVG